MSSQKGSLEWGPPLLPWMLEAVGVLGFGSMTPVQAAAIPLLTGNKDVVAEAVTGSGKTLAFLFPLLIRLSKIEEPLHTGQMNAIIVEPTRELAYQTHKVLEELLNLSPDPKIVRTQLITGGNQSSRIQDTKIFLQTKPHVLIATPGRLLDLLSAQHVNTRALDLLVFDEGDKLLDQVTDNTIPKILAKLPKQKRAALFSATMNADVISDIIRMGMRNPVKLKVSAPTHATPDVLRLEYFNYGSDPREKIPLAINLLQSTPYKKAIVYIPTCTSVTYWYQVFQIFLPQNNTDSAKLYSLHGKLLQGTRLKTLTRFTDDLNRSILLTTDVAARGLDIPGVDFVLQLDPPTDPNMFVHRAGRTGRAGKAGLCSVLLNGDLELGYVDFMSVRKVNLVEGVLKNCGDETKNSKMLDSCSYINRLQTWVREDRARHDLALRSFLSFVRYYMKHTASSIFRLSSLDLFSIAKSFGILRMPRMPELKDKEVLNDGWLTEPFNFDEEYKYLDSKQEGARLDKLASQKKNGSTDPQLDERLTRKKRNATAWSGKLERTKTAQARREKRLRKAISRKNNSGDGQLDNMDDEATTTDWKEVVTERKNKKIKAAPEFTFDL